MYTYFGMVTAFITSVWQYLVLQHHSCTTFSCYQNHRS